MIEAVLINRGSSENPLSEKDIVLKFKSNAAHALSPEDVTILEAAINILENEKNIDKITEIFRSKINFRST